MLTTEGSRNRQDRLRALMARNDIDQIFITDPRDILYLTGLQLHPAGSAALLPSLLCLPLQGKSWLASHTLEGDSVVDERLAYEPSLLYTLNPDLLRRLDAAVASRLAGSASTRRIGYQSESMPALLGATIATHLQPDTWTAIDDDLQQLQRLKDPDEIAAIRQAIACSEAAYEAARANIAPGANELAVLSAGITAANLAGNEPVFHSGDYRSGSFGGFARDRAIEEGELYIIDAWTAWRGYWSDLCRVFPVGEISVEQQEIHAFVASIVSDLNSELKPGLHTSDLWFWLDRRLRQHPDLKETGLIHHGGHGTGTRAHEAPDINRDRGELLQAGMVVSVEPGAYLPQWRAGVRIENTWLITADGCQLLSAFPTS